MSLQPNSVHIVLRASKGVWQSLEEEFAKAADPNILLVQGQAKTYRGNGAVNAATFAQQTWNDHPGPAPSKELRARVEKALRDPKTTVHLYNSFVGEHANARARAGEFMLAHLNSYKQGGGLSTLVYHMLYDCDGRNDKIHMVEQAGPNGTTIMVSENNAPGGVYAPIMYRAIGADYISVFDPHSRLHIQNLTNAFGKKFVRVNSNLDAISEKIIEHHFDEILSGKFRLGAPDGWDKKDDKKKNMAIERVCTVGKLLWEKMGGLEAQYRDLDNFLKTIEFGVVKKRRALYPGDKAKSYVESVHGDFEDCACVLVDDLVDSGDSVIQSAQALLSKGAAMVDAAICHGPAEQQSLLHIVNSTFPVKGQTRVVIDHFITTNTMPRIEEFVAELTPDQARRVTVINCGEGLVRDLQRFHPKPRGLDII